MTETPTSDAADFSAVLVSDGVERQVTIRVSPRPTSPEGWENVVQAMSDFLRDHPERFS